MSGDDLAFLGALQLADSALPVGRFVHSSGLESWLRAHPAATTGDVEAVIASAVLCGVATLDAVAVAHAHRAAAPDELATLDRWLHVRKLAGPTREASIACGRQLARLGRSVAPADRCLAEHADRVDRERTPGHAAVVSGALARAYGLDERRTVLLELSAAASALLSAAVRLGAVPPTRAQVALRGLHEELADVATRACASALADATTGTPELELFVLAHRRAGGRSFAS